MSFSQRMNDIGTGRKADPPWYHQFSHNPNNVCNTLSGMGTCLPPVNVAAGRSAPGRPSVLCCSGEIFQREDFTLWRGKNLLLPIMAGNWLNLTQNGAKMQS
jgi:hypothetical protein